MHKGIHNDTNLKIIPLYPIIFRYNNIFAFIIIFLSTGQIKTIISKYWSNQI